MFREGLGGVDVPLALQTIFGILQSRLIRFLSPAKHIASGSWTNEL